jgi:hypothetical protein
MKTKEQTTIQQTLDLSVKKHVTEKCYRTAKLLMYAVQQFHTYHIFLLGI